MVSTMAMLVVGFTGVCAALSKNFYRKYQARLVVGSRQVVQYARIADYIGVPLRLAFEYRIKDGTAWSRVEMDVEEIYHYGSDYFLRGYSLLDRKDCICKWNRIANLRIRSNGRSLNSVEALLGEVSAKEVRSVA